MSPELDKLCAIVYRLGHMEQLSILRNLLSARMGIVADRAFYERDPAGHLGELQRVSEELATAAGHLPQNTDPMLRHYLEKQSYVKALDWLDAHLDASVSDVPRE